MAGNETMAPPERMIDNPYSSDVSNQEVAALAFRYYQVAVDSGHDPSAVYGICLRHALRQHEFEKNQRREQELDRELERQLLQRCQAWDTENNKMQDADTAFQQFILSSPAPASGATFAAIENPYGTLTNDDVADRAYGHYCIAIRSGEDPEVAYSLCLQRAYREHEAEKHQGGEQELCLAMLARLFRTHHVACMATRRLHNNSYIFWFAFGTGIQFATFLPLSDEPSFSCFSHSL